MGTVLFQDKIGVLTLENGIYEISVDGHGRAKIFLTEVLWGLLNL